MMKQTFEKAYAWSKRDDVRAVVTTTVLVATLAIYAVIFYVGRRPAPPTSPSIPLLLRLHPERLVACGESLFGMFVLRRRLRDQKPLLEPLSWIFLASLVHLSSLAIQFHSP